MALLQLESRRPDLGPELADRGRAWPQSKFRIMAVPSGGVPPHFKAQFQQRLGIIGQQAEGLKNSGTPEVVSSFLDSSITGAVEEFAPKSELEAYLSMVRDTACNLGERVELRQKLWENALSQTLKGVPGGAGVALAKSVEHLNRELPLTDRGRVAGAALLEMRTHHDQTVKGEQEHATVALDAAAAQRDPNVADLISQNAISTVAEMEDWNFSP